MKGVKPLNLPLLFALALLLALAQPAMAQFSQGSACPPGAPPNSQCFTEQNINALGVPLSFWFGNWMGTVLALALLSVLLIALAYAIAIGFNMRTLRVWADHELVQAVANVLILSLFFAILIAFDTLTNEMVVSCQSSPDCSLQLGGSTLSCSSSEPCAITFTKAYITNMEEVAHNMGQNYLANAAYYGSKSMERSGKFSNLMALGFYGYIDQPNAGMSILMERNNTLFDMTSQLLGSLEAQRFFVDFAANVLGPALILLGTMLRFFFPTRHAGGLLMSIGIALVLVWPMLYVFSWMTLKIAVFGDQAAASAGTCPQECRVEPALAVDMAKLASVASSKPKCLDSLTAFGDPECVGNYKVLYSTANVSLLPLDHSQDDPKNPAPVTQKDLTYCSNITFADGTRAEGACESDNNPSHVAINCPVECREIPFQSLNPSCVESECNKCPNACKIYRERIELSDPDSKCTASVCPLECRTYQSAPALQMIKPEGNPSTLPASYTEADPTCDLCLGANGQAQKLNDPAQETGADVDCPSFCRIMTVSGDSGGNLQMVYGPAKGDPNYAQCSKIAACKPDQCPVACRRIIPTPSATSCDSICSDTAGNVCPTYCRVAGIPSSQLPPECSSDYNDACNACNAKPSCLAQLPEIGDSGAQNTCSSCQSICRSNQIPSASDGDFVEFTVKDQNNAPQGYQYFPDAPYQGPCSFAMVGDSPSPNPQPPTNPCSTAPPAAPACAGVCYGTGVIPICRPYDDAAITSSQCLICPPEQRLKNSATLGVCSDQHCPDSCKLEAEAAAGGATLPICLPFETDTTNLPQCRSCPPEQRLKSSTTPGCSDQYCPDLCKLVTMPEGTTPPICLSYDDTAIDAIAPSQCLICPLTERLKSSTTPGCSDQYCPDSCKVAAGGTAPICVPYRGVSLGHPDIAAALTNGDFSTLDVTTLTPSVPLEGCQQCPFECRWDVSSSSVDCNQPIYACGVDYCSNACKNVPLNLPTKTPSDPPIFCSGSSELPTPPPCWGCPDRCRLADVTLPADCPAVCFDPQLCPSSLKSTVPVDVCGNCAGTNCPVDFITPLQCTPNSFAVASGGGSASQVYACTPNFVRSDCANYCTTFGNPALSLSPEDYIRYGGGAGVFGSPDVAAVGLLYLPAYVLPLLNVVVTLAFIRVFSMFLGGDLEIPGLSRIL